MIFSSIVPSSVKRGVSLIEYLSARFTYYDSEEWRARVRSGAVTRNGLPADSDEAVSPGNTITYDAGEFEEPPANLAYRIVYEDPWLFGIDKPGNLLVHRAGKSFRNNLIYQLRYLHVPPYPGCHAVHRLDRDTSGVVLVAKSSEECAALGSAFLDGGVDKTYLAVVQGTPPPGDIDLPIGKMEHSEISYKFCVDPGGKNSSTRIIESRPLGEHHSLLTIQPITGRTHQIRVHLAAIGNPVVGDKLYGLSEAEYLRWRSDPLRHGDLLPFPRHALHCAALTLTHPYTKEVCRIEAEMPPDMRELAGRLACNAGVGGKAESR